LIGVDQKRLAHGQNVEFDPERAACGTEREEMIVTSLRHLEEMAAKVEATARKLPQRPDRDELLRDIAKFRAQLVRPAFEAGSEGK
jgi:hypothetical protein